MGLLKQILTNKTQNAVYVSVYILAANSNLRSHCGSGRVKVITQQTML